MKTLLVILLLNLQCVLLATSCNEDPSQTRKTYTREELMQVNREKLNRETAQIHKYIEHRHWNMNETSTGLRYEIYHDDSGATAQNGQLVTIAYQAYLLDSTRIAGTSPDVPETFRVGHDNVISGLHEAVQLLSVGDSARLIVPSHLAYGFTGDYNIPANAPILYDIELLDIQQ